MYPRVIFQRSTALKFIIVTIFVFLITSMTAFASNSGTYTYTRSVDNGWIRTQDAYLVGEVILRNENMNQPQDIYIFADKLYVADKGNRRIVIYDLITKHSSYIGEEELQGPTGVFVAKDGTVYVADNATEVVKFSAEGKLLHRYGRPNTITFGEDTSYMPSKVMVNDSGIIFVISEGSYDGIIQLDQQGEFLGYFGYNNNPITLWNYIEDRLFTDAQKAQLFRRVPYTFKNIAIDDLGIIYTVTQNAEGNALKKHDVAGLNLFSNEMTDEKNFIDVTLGPDGQIYTVTETGLIFEYDMDGNLLFTFGGRASATERNGLFTTVTGIACNSDGRLYVLDGERGLVHVMNPTGFADAVHEAMKQYNQGQYAESKVLWESISAIGGLSYFAENSLAQCLYQLRQYDEAAIHYRIAGNRSGYSQAYWHIRNQSLYDLLPYAIAVIVLLVIVISILKKRKSTSIDGSLNIWKEDLKLVFRTLRHPIDSFYAIRREGAGHIVTALVLYILSYLVFVAYNTMSGFVLIGNAGGEVSFEFVSLIFLVPLALFVGSNYMVCEVVESEARIRDIFISTAYVLSPFTVFMPFLIIISHFITISESRLLHLAIAALIIWVVINLFIATKEIHAYKFSSVISHLLITLFFMGVIVLAASLVYMFWDQLVRFIYAVIKEVEYRVS